MGGEGRHDVLMAGLRLLPPASDGIVRNLNPSIYGVCVIYTYKAKLDSLSRVHDIDAQTGAVSNEAF